jgi:hypothetical protein
MKTRRLFLGLLGLGLALSFPLASAQAQATRTWVSGLGDDANPCSRTAPCKTFAGALSKTAAGGEIDALDPAGYGPVTITQAITIDGGGGQVASVLAAGVDGIVVSAQPNDTVILRNLQINGLAGSGSPGVNGIRFLSGAFLSVENCAIFGFSAAGIDAATTASATLNVIGSKITNTLNGITFESPGGIFGAMDHTTIQKVTNDALTVTSGFTIFNVSSSNIFSTGVIGVNAGSQSVFNIDTTSVSNNNTAFATTGGSIRLSRNAIYDNDNNYSIAGGGTVLTSGDNVGVLNGATVPNGTLPKQ